MVTAGWTGASRGAAVWHSTVSAADDLAASRQLREPAGICAQILCGDVHGTTVVGTCYYPYQRLPAARRSTITS
jgi:hypothetical protein